MSLPVASPCLGKRCTPQQSAHARGARVSSALRHHEVSSGHPGRRRPNGTAADKEDNSQINAELSVASTCASICTDPHFGRAEATCELCWQQQSDCCQGRERELLNVAGQQHAEAIGDDLAKRCGRGDAVSDSGGSRACRAARVGATRSRATTAIHFRVVRARAREK